MPFGFVSSDPFSTLYSLQSAAGLVFLAFLPALMWLISPLMQRGAGSGILEGTAILPPLAFFTGGSILILKAVKKISPIPSLNDLDDDVVAPTRASLRLAFAAAPGQHVADFTRINKGLPQAGSARKPNSGRAGNVRLCD